MLLCNDQCTVASTWYLHALQLQASFPDHTFQFPTIIISKTIKLQFQDVNVPNRHNSTSRRRISSSAFQSGQISGKDRLSCCKIACRSSSGITIFTGYDTKYLSAHIDLVTIFKIATSGFRKD
jgi:hypothetical protein